MTEVIFKAFKQQGKFLKDKNRFKFAAAGRRSGKTEIGAIQAIVYQETKPGFVNKGIDPYLGVITAPTYDMLNRLSWKKFRAYANPFIESHTVSPKFIRWHDGSEVVGISADSPERIEGIKANWIWIDEVFQVSEQFFLECMARVSDSQGYLFCTGSLGVQYINPKQHWAYRYFKEQTHEQFSLHEWVTADNPTFPREELTRLSKLLDQKTYEQMFMINWDTTPLNAVYSNLSDDNLLESPLGPDHPVIVSIDWGFAHPMAVGFFQIDEQSQTVYQIDEIVESRMNLEQMYSRIMSKNYNISEWVCDIAGNQAREQTGRSNISWFKDKGVRFKARRTEVLYGIPIVRSFIKNGANEVKFYLSHKCKKTFDALKSYRYAEKDGQILNENPIKRDDDPCDMVRYFFVNIMDPKMRNRTSSMHQL